MVADPQALGFRVVNTLAQAGDVALFSPGPAQAHVAIVAPDHASWIHAHAGLRRVVIQPASPMGRELGRWRLI